MYFFWTMVLNWPEAGTQTDFETENDLVSYRNPAALWCLLNSVSASEVERRWHRSPLRKAKPKNQSPNKTDTRASNHLTFITSTTKLLTTNQAGWVKLIKAFHLLCTLQNRKILYCLKRIKPNIRAIKKIEFENTIIFMSLISGCNMTRVSWDSTR